MLLPACATVTPIDCAQFPSFGPNATSEGPALADRQELLAAAQSYPSPDRAALAGAFAALGKYDSAFEMASLPGGSGSQEDAHLAIVVAAAGNGDLDAALRANEQISYSRNVARANLAIAVVQGKAGQEQAARSSIDAAQDANSNMVRQYAYHSLLSWELAQAGEFDRAREQAELISDGYWGYRVHALVRIAWAQYEAGNANGAIGTLDRAASVVDRSGSPSLRWWSVRDFRFLLAELYLHVGHQVASDPQLRSASHTYMGELYNAGDFDRVSAVLLWDELAELAGRRLANGLDDDLEERAIQNLIVDNRTIGVPSLFHDFAKTELVRYLMEQGRSDWVYESRDSLDGDQRSSLGLAITHAEASRGNLDRALSAAAQIDDLRDQCIAYVWAFVELVDQDRGDDASRVVGMMEDRNCFRLAPELPDDLYADLAAGAAGLGDGTASCHALQAVERGEPWRTAVSDIAGARAAKGDFSAARAIVRWAHSVGNLGGTEASEILAAIAALEPASRDRSAVYPPVLGSTATFANLQRWTRRDPVWFEDGIWDQ